MGTEHPDGAGGSSSRQSLKTTLEIRKMVMLDRAGLLDYVPEWYLTSPMPTYSKHQELDFREGVYWDTEEDGEQTVDEYTLPPDGFAPLNGDRTDMVGFLRFDDHVFLQRERSNGDMRRDGLIIVPAIPNQGDSANDNPKDRFGMTRPAVMHQLRYRLRANADRLILLADISDMIWQVGVRGSSEPGSAIARVPAPTLEEAIKASTLRLKGSVMAAPIPMTVFYGRWMPYDQRGSYETKRWHLMHVFDLPPGMAPLDSAAILSSDATIMWLLGTPELAHAIRIIDLHAWSTAHEIYHFLRTKTARRIKAISAGVGMFLLGALVKDAVGAGVGDGADASGADSAGVDGTDIPALGDVPITAGVEAADQLGTDYSDGLKFGAAVDVYEPAGTDKVTEVNFPGSSSTGTDKYGHEYSVNQWGSITKKS